MKINLIRNIFFNLKASYDSSGSIPTTDLSMETRATHDSTYPQRVQPMPYAKQPQKPLEDPFISPASQPVCVMCNMTTFFLKKRLYK